MRAVESASYPVVEYLIEKGAKINQENKQGNQNLPSLNKIDFMITSCFLKGKTAFDIAKDFADPRVYLIVKNKFESIPKPKDGKKSAKKKETKKKKKDPEV